MNKIVFIVLIGLGTFFEGFTQLKIGPSIGLGQAYLKLYPLTQIHNFEKNSNFSPVWGAKAELPFRNEKVFVAANLSYQKIKNIVTYKRINQTDSSPYYANEVVKNNFFMLSFDANYFLFNTISAGLGLNYIYGKNYQNKLSYLDDYYLENFGVTFNCAYHIKKSVIGISYSNGIYINDRKRDVLSTAVFKPINAISFSLAYLFETKLFSKYY